MKIICPGCQNLQEYNQKKKHNKRPRTRCKKCSKWIEVNKDTIVLNNDPVRKKKGKTNNSHNFASSANIIDDPIELLYSVSIRELNRPEPDPRWASILKDCIKEKIGKSTKVKELEEEFKRYPTDSLVKLLSKS